MRGALARISTPDRCSARSTAPCDSPCLFSSSAIVAPASYSCASTASCSGMRLCLRTTTRRSRRSRSNADGAIPCSFANLVALSPASYRRTISAICSASSRAESRWIRYLAGAGTGSRGFCCVASFRNPSGVKTPSELFDRRSIMPASKRPHERPFSFQAVGHVFSRCALTDLGCQVLVT